MSEQETKWYDKKGLVAVLCVIIWPVGLYGLWKSNVFPKSWKIGGTLLVLLAFIMIVNAGSKKSDDDSSMSSVRQESAAAPAAQTGEYKPGAPQSPENASKADTSQMVTVGQVLKTRYFDVTVNHVQLSDMVDTGNEFADLKQEPGNNYLIINLTMKNTDEESRMMFEGVVWIDYNGKRWKFDNTETILLEGWGMILDQINPLTTKTTKLVFKVPAEIKGPAYYQPGRSSGGKMIYLGNL